MISSSQFDFTLLKGDRNSRVWRELEPWIGAAANLYGRHVSEQESFPFHAHEQCAVSFLVGAAYHAGYLALAECDVDKDERLGRSDLWIAIADRQYWFEFKRASFDPGKKRWGLRHALAVVESDLDKLFFDQGEVGVACVIAATDCLSAENRDLYLDFAEEFDFSLRLGPDDESGAYLYLKVTEH